MIKLCHYGHRMEIIEMTEATPTNGRFHFKWLFPLLVHPRQTFEHVLIRKATWYTPMLVISLLLIAQVFVRGFLNPPASELVPSEGFPTEGVPSKGMEVGGGSGVEGMDAVATVSEPSSGWRDSLLPAASKLAGLWIGWFVLTLLLFVALVISGSQGNFTSALNLTAWSSLPFAVQVLVQIIIALIYTSATNLPQGLAGLALKVQGMGGEFLGIIFQRVDIFLIWQAVLLMIGAVFISQLPAGKVRWLVLLAIVIYLVLAALPAFGMQQFSLLQSAAQPKY
jgi:hypothetical protein